MLGSSRRSELRAQAHKLKPVVLIGDKGLTESVLAEVDRALKSHELIKVKAASDNRELRSGWLRNICATLGAEPVQEIGKILVVFRENPTEKPDSRPRGDDRPRARDKPRAKVKPRERAEPREKAKSRGKGKLWSKKPRAKVEAATGTSRRRSRTPSPLPESAPRRRRPRTSR